MPLMFRILNKIPNVPVIRQTERRNSMDVERWNSVASQEFEKVSSMTRPQDGYHTVLLLDISESISTGDSWRRAKTFVNDFLAGLEEHSGLYEPPRHVRECVALVTFGHKTQVEVPITKDFHDIRHRIDNLELGGPSPLLGGLLVAKAGIRSAQNTPALFNNVSLHNKIIVITDGEPTEVSLSSGPDFADESQRDQEMAFIVQQLEELTDDKVSVFFVGVANCNSTFLNSIHSSDPYRNLFSLNDGRRLARRNYLCKKAVINDIPSGPWLQSNVLDVQIPEDEEMTDEDHSDIRDIAATTRRHVLDSRNAKARHADTSDAYRESNCKTLPIIGSRVRRGPDWKWDNQDHYGVGTVIGHCSDDSRIWVQWDAVPAGYAKTYRYGKNGFFDVLVVDELRKLNPCEHMAIGCRVRLGKDGKFQNIHSWNKGVVIRLQPPKSQVRWDSGIRGKYSYGADGKFEIELCDNV